MSLRTKLRILTENLLQQHSVAALFLPETERGEVELISYLTASAADSGAELSLLNDPARPVALVLNAGRIPEEIEERKRALDRRYSRAAPSSNWHVAFARPDVDAWIMADPRVRQEFEADETTRQSPRERAARIERLGREAPLDRDAIGRAHPEFRSLVEFVERHVGVSQPVAST